MRESFTLAEAAAITEVSPEAIRTAIEKKFIKPSYRKRVGKATRHQFSENDLLLIKALVEFPFALSKADKSSLAEVLANGNRQSGPWLRRGCELIHRANEMELRFEIRRIMQKVAANLAVFRWGRRRIVSSPGVLAGEPIFRGTRVPLEHVALLFRKGVPVAEIAEDLPHLSSRDLEYARLSAHLIRKPGRPRKSLRLLRASPAR
jgi:uncharacterized protein (DUF433 family)